MEKPNFVLIMTDQHRGDCLSIAGHPCVQTPTFDHIASQGTYFRRGYSTCPSCIPARKSVLSGQSPSRNGTVGFLGAEWDAPTLPGELRKAGYQTLMIGRDMHQQPSYKRYGFDHMQLSSTFSPAGSPYTDLLPGNEDGANLGFFDHGINANGFTARPWHLDESTHEVHWTVGEGLKAIKRRDPTTPFFMILSFFGPHPPLTPPAPYYDRYLNMDLPEPAIGDWAQPPPNDGVGVSIDSDWVNLRGHVLRQCQAGYFGLINYIDDQIHRFRMHLGRVSADVAKNTVFLFCSDHGEMLGDHYLFRKCYPFEGSARIPFGIGGPEHFGFKRGTVSDHPVALEDLMPTVLDLADVPIPDSVDGQSLVPILRGESDHTDRPILHGEHSPCYRDYQANHYLTDGHEKYVWLPAEGQEFLFDLDADPQELHNLIAEPAHAERATWWREQLIARLHDRPEGFTDGARLIPGRPYHALLPHADPAYGN